MSAAVEFIYRQTSNRICQKIKERRLPYAEILSSDPKILSYIVNCKCTSKNSFLIPDRVFYNPLGSDGLIPKLFFPERNTYDGISDDELMAYKCEILWGKRDERIDYAKELFIKIMYDLYNSKENKENGDYENIFCAHVPFSKNYTYKQVTDANPDIPLLYYGILTIVPPKQLLWDAASFLYQEIKTQYEDAFLEYTNNKDTFKKIKHDFSKIFVKGKLVPILKKYIEQEHPLGLRVRELILGELSLVPTMLNGTMDKQQMKYYRALNRATTEYFLALEAIQAKKHQ